VKKLKWQSHTGVKTKAASVYVFMSYLFMKVSIVDGWRNHLKTTVIIQSCFLLVWVFSSPVVGFLLWQRLAMSPFQPSF